MVNVLRLLSRLGVTRGFLGNSRAWTIVGASALTIRAFKRLFGGTPQEAYSHKLTPGETVVITRDREARVVRAPP